MNQGLGESVVYVSGKGINIVEIITIAIQKGPKCLAISVCTAVAGGQCDSVVLTMGTAVCKMVYGDLNPHWKMTSLRQPSLRQPPQEYASSTARIHNFNLVHVFEHH